MNVLDRIVDSPECRVILKLCMVTSFMVMARMSDTFFASVVLVVVAILCAIFFDCHQGA